jgi:dTDP-4-dehydrorhamnose reductase
MTTNATATIVDMPPASDSLPVLVTGAGGQLGIALQRCPWPEGWTVVAIGQETVDFRDSDAIIAYTTKGHQGRPFAAIINAAAYTVVDKAEEDIVTAWAVNAMAPAALAQVCAAAAIPLVQVSTDYVFAGDKPGVWEVDDPVDPINVYGASKLGGEMAVRTSGARHAIVRTAWVMSPHGTNFVKTMLRIGASHDTLKVIDDQRGSPTSAADLAGVLMMMTMRLVEDVGVPSGTFHFSNAGDISWADFADEIFRQSALRGGPSARVVRIPSRDYPTPAARPSNSRLSHDAIRAAYGIAPRPWQVALSDILDDLIGPPASKE